MNKDWPTANLSTYARLNWHLGRFRWVERYINAPRLRLTPTLAGLRPDHMPPLPPRKPGEGVEDGNE